MRGQSGEAAGGQGAQERLQLLSGRGVTEALLRGRRRVGDGEAEGVVVDEAEGRRRLAAGQPGREQRSRNASARASDAGLRGSRILSSAATPGRSSRTDRRRCASAAICAVQGWAGSTWQSTSARTASRMRSYSCSLLRTWRYSAPGTTPRRAARARMLRACAPPAAMTVRPSATTRSRVSARRLVFASPGRVEPERERVRFRWLPTCHCCLPLCLRTGAAFDSEQSSL